MPGTMPGRDAENKQYPKKYNGDEAKQNKQNSTKEGVQYAAGRTQLQPDKGRSFLSPSPGPYAGKTPARQGFPEASTDGPGSPGQDLCPV